MKRFLLLFLSAPTAIGVILPLIASTQPALAEGSTHTPPTQFCVNTHARLVCVKSSHLASSNTSNSTLMARAEAEAKNPDAFVNFNEEESDGAIALFGCDCPACIRSLRQLRIMSAVS